jgi:hypothetical protein
VSDEPKVVDEALIAAWIQYHRGHRGDPAKEPLFWAWELLTELVRADPSRAWRIILAIFDRDKSDRIYENLSAGPLEDLLVYHGPEIIEGIEERARLDPAFRDLLGGVWQNAIRDDIWARVEAARGEPW